MGTTAVQFEVVYAIQQTANKDEYPTFEVGTGAVDSDPGIQGTLAVVGADRGKHLLESQTFPNLPQIAKPSKGNEVKYSQLFFRKSISIPP